MIRGRSELRAEFALLRTGVTLVVGSMLGCAARARPNGARRAVLGADSSHHGGLGLATHRIRLPASAAQR
jgi:hypothetical protein